MDKAEVLRSIPGVLSTYLQGMGLKAQGGPTGDPMLDGFFDKDPSRVYYRLAYHLTKELKPTCSVELGTECGYFAAHLAAGNPDGMVWAVDPDAKDIFHIQHRFSNIVLLEGTSIDPTVLAKFEEESVDLLFIDSLHVAQYTLWETALWSPKMKRGGVILYDDVLHDEMRGVLYQLPFREKGLLPKMHPSGLGYAVVR